MLAAGVPATSTWSWSRQRQHDRLAKAQAIQQGLKRAGIKVQHQAAGHRAADDLITGEQARTTT